MMDCHIFTALCLVFGSCVNCTNLITYSYPGYEVTTASPAYHTEYRINFDLNHPGIISSPDFNGMSYENNVRFTWRLQVENQDQNMIMMYGLYFHTEGCCDIVTVEWLSQRHGNWYIHEGQFHYAGFYSQEASLLQRGPGSIANVTFVSDSTVTFKGFVIRYVGINRHTDWAVQSSQYSATYDLYQLSLAALWPRNVHDKEIQFTIAASYYDRVELNIVYMDMITTHHCNVHYLKVFDASLDDGGMHEGPLLLRVCRNRTRATMLQVISHSNSLVIKYSCHELYHYPSFNTSCAILNYRLSDQTTYEEGETHFEIPGHTIPYMQWYTELPDPNEIGIKLNCYHVRLAIKMAEKAFILLQTSKTQFYENSVEIIVEEYPGNLMKRTTICYKALHKHQYFKEIWSHWPVLSATEFHDVWISYHNMEIVIGRGWHVGKNRILQLYTTEQPDFNYIRVRGRQGEVKIYQAYIDGQREMFSGASGEIFYSVPHGSFHTKSWAITKVNPRDILTLEVTSNSLLWSPDCITERVSIYRGHCATKAMRLAYFCGGVFETYTQTHDLTTSIEFYTRIEDTALVYQQGLSGGRHVTIYYRTSHTDEQTWHVGRLSAGAIILMVIGLLVVIAVISAVVICIKVNKRNSQTPTVQPARILGYHTQHRQDSGPVTVNINITNTGPRVLADTPNQTMIYEGRSGILDANYSVVPPPAIYDPPRLYQAPQASFQS